MDDCTIAIYSFIDDLLKAQMTRKCVKTMIGEINRMFPKKIYATDLEGFLLKILLFVFAFQLDKALLQ